ncbi:protein javelin [Drosophila ficusphila]|uniref:protein javelin n=1 Tax=Drosophila ficusphila TaxID=30025 RepID=UPI0007E7C0B6|nr:protein javelin [Drosophila ficusphila]
MSGKESYSYQHNYVDRVRLEDTTGGHQHHSSHQQTTHDPRCPQLRAAGWRHTHKSVSHLDLATSCHEAAGTGLGRHSQPLHHHSQAGQNQPGHHHLHHSHSHSHHQHTHAQPHWTQCRVGVAGSGNGNGQLRNARSLDYTQLEREENALDIAEFYWRFDAEAPIDQADSYAVLPISGKFEPSAVTKTGSGSGEATTTSTTTASGKSNDGATTTTNSAVATALLDILGSESCSLRRSRSLAVIREETFSDLQIGSANSSRRRSQLIPRARLVNRGFFRESPRLNGKPSLATLVGEQPADQPADDTQSQRSNSGTCDSHQQQQQQLQQQHQQHQHQQQQPQQQHQRLNRESRDFDVYYDNLKRLDALALGLGEQLHPWHNDKSDLESLNSDYFKNSLHQNHLEQQQPSSLEFDALEQVATDLLKERPRIYQSRRQQQRRNLHHSNCLQRHLDTGGESCPEHSQSSVFPETTTSNSDDQTDSPSLSEQEYDLTHIEEIYQQGNEGEESYELISLTTTTRTRFESSEEGEGEENQAEEEVVESLTTPTEPQTSDSDSTLRQNHNEQLDKLIAYDSVYLSSEDSSDCTLIGESCESFEQRTFTSCGESGELETRSLLHISIEDTVYEPQAKQHKKGVNHEDQPASLLTTTAKVEAQIFTQVLKVEHTPKPKILAVVEKRKLKQEEVKQQPPELKRQATDSFVVTAASKSNLTANQYHSLPDVNIGVSLKVCENIDKELRSSYNQRKQQQRKEAKREQQVTRAETYDSIRRFGRAHQKARQKEYQEREREREREASAALQEKDKEREKPRINKEYPAQERKIEVKESSKVQEVIKKKEELPKEKAEEEEEPLPPPPPPPPLTEEPQPESNPAEVEEVEDDLSESISQPEQPKEAPVIEVANFSRLIERRAQEIRERQEQIKPSFQIIVTDAQNNIIQKEAIADSKEIRQRTNPKPNTNTKPKTNSNSNSSCNPIQRPLRRSVSSSSGKPLEHRILSTGAPIYKARPVKVLPSSSSDSSFCRGKMSRPQILHVVDGRAGVAGGAGGAGGGSLQRRSSARSIASTISSAGGEAANEYLQKVDAVRCYWNKLAGNEPETPKTEQQPTKESQPGLNFQLGGETTTQCTDKSPVGSDFCSMMPHPSIEIVELGEGAQKATIVKAAAEQDEDPDEDQDQFDHIRYKVLKSQQLIRNNFLSTRNKKEAQFDGLIQYLQEYSFQELLSNNNVVIVEPVRTKIERPLQVGISSGSSTTTVPPPKPPRVANASGSQPRKLRNRPTGGAAAKRHFFYQPVRVNRELYEDELPDPDTVRNVRRFFEQNVMPTPGQGLLVQSQQKFGGSACQLSPKSRRARGYRYLTIDTSFGGAGEEQPKGMELLEENKAKHWDNASLSSGISSGDLSSPCGEYLHQESPVIACKDVHVQDVVRRHNSNAANAKARAKIASRRTWCMGTGPGGAGANESLYRQIYENNLGHSEQQENGEHLEEEDDEQDDQYEDDVDQDMCENYYVSNDVLAKIRECGSTVTYYGGRVLDKTAASSTAPPTKATQPITGSGTRSRIRQIESCNVCLPSERCEHRLQTKQTTAEQQQDSYQGIKFKLVKSNSCSSRLELAGTGEDEVSADSEVVRKMVHHFEANRTAAGNDAQLTINSQSQITSAKELEEVPRRQVTVNNHINVLGDVVAQELGRAENFNGQPENGYGTEMVVPTYESQAMNIRLDVTENKNSLQAAANKVCRNKNVDLAYTLVKPTTNSQKGKPIEAPRQKIGKQQREVEENGENGKNAVTKSVKLAKAAAPQIIVPVDIHSQTSIAAPASIPERRLSNASSSNSVVDKTVVRHYVANDKSIYERRKYDEIEFEEFEVYDPSKEPPPQVEGGPEKVPTDAELYDSLDDKV